MPGANQHRSAAYLHDQLLRGLGDSVVSKPTNHELHQKPLTLELRSPLPSTARFYVYLTTAHPSERSPGDHRIQIILPDHRQTSRPHFDRSGGAIPFLLGYVPEFDVFVLWDADLQDFHRGIPYSKGTQVHAGTIYEAAAVGSARQLRRTRPGGWNKPETVIAARASGLVEALLERRETTIQALLQRS